MTTIIVLLIIFIIALFTIFIIKCQELSIVDDIGVIKLVLFSAGLIIYYFNYMFLTYTSYSECSFNFLFKHFGLLLSLSILYLMININLELGINPKSILNNSCQLNVIDDVSINNETDTNMSFCKSITSDFSSNYIKPRDIKSSLQRIIVQEKNTINTKTKDLEINEQIIQKIRYTISLHFQVVSVYFISIVIITLVILANIKNNNNIVDVPDVNGNWFYECKLENYDLGFDMFELIIFSLLLIKCNQISHYNEVFKYTKSISHSTKIGIFLGPVLNVIIKDKYIIKKKIILIFYLYIYIYIYIYIIFY